MLKNKLTEYIFQVICIVTGVTVSFYVEAYREESKKRAAEKEYVSALLENLAEDKISLHKNISLFDEMASSIDELVAMSHAANFDVDEFYRLSYKLTVLSDFIPNSHTYDEMTAASQVSSLSNASIRSRVIGLYNFYKDLQNDDLLNKQQQQNSYMDYMSKNIDEEAWSWAIANRSIPNDHAFAGDASKAVFDKKFRNQLVNLQATVKQCRRQYYEALEKCDAVSKALTAKQPSL